MADNTIEKIVGLVIAIGIIMTIVGWATGFISDALSQAITDFIQNPIYLSFLAVT